MKRIILITICMLLLLPKMQLKAQEVEKYRQIVRTFEIKPGNTINITNKYGNIELKQWNKDSVRYDIRLKASAKTEDRLTKMLSTINFKFTNSLNSSVVQTYIGSSSNDLLSEIQNLTNSLFSVGIEIEIDYQVYVPKDCRIKIDNMFGDVYLNDLSQDIDIKLAHGDLRMGDITGDAKLDLRFSNAYINSFKKLDCNSDYSEIEIVKVEDLYLTSRASQIDLENVGYIIIDSKKDDISIDNVKQLSGSSSFSKIKIEEFDKIIDLNTKLGAINLKHVPATFSSINIRSEYTNITLMFDKKASFNLNFKHTNVDYRIPEEQAHLEYVEISKDDDIGLTHGYVGANKNTRSKVDIEAENGALKIYYR